MLVGLFCVQAVLGLSFGTLKRSDWEDTQPDDYNYPSEFEAGRDHVIVGLKSEWSSKWDDRLYEWYYRPLPAGMTCEPASWTSYQNEYEGALIYDCPDGMALNGVKSVHENAYDDRRFKLKCCDITSGGRFSIPLRKKSGPYYNARYEKDEDHIPCDTDEVITGVYSVFNGSPDDRMWGFFCGQVEEFKYDDCTDVTVVDVEIGDIEMGTTTRPSVNKYTTTFKACGTSNVPDKNEVEIQGSESVEVTEELTLEKSLEESFSFSHTMGTTFSMSHEVTLKIDAGVKSVEGTTKTGLDLRTDITSESGTTTTSSQTNMQGQGTVDLNVLTTTSEFKPEAYQWREVQASYVKMDVVVPLTMKTQCKLKFGGFKTTWMKSTLTAASYSDIKIDYIDRTAECPEEYYKSCKCVEELKSDYLTGDGCQTHPYHNGHPGCYVYKYNGQDCGNGQGLGAAKPPANALICDDPSKCPASEKHYDYPLDKYTFEWSYIPCGGDKYYPGDVKYDGPNIDDLVWKKENTHCISRSRDGGSLGPKYVYESRAAAILACDEINREAPGTCFGIYDPYCDNSGDFYLCDAKKPELVEKSRSSCVWEMQHQYEFLEEESKPVEELLDAEARRLEGRKNTLPKAPAPIARASKSAWELAQEFGSDYYGDNEELAPLVAPGPHRADAAPLVAAAP